MPSISTVNHTQLVTRSKKSEPIGKTLQELGKTHSNSELNPKESPKKAPGGVEGATTGRELLKPKPPIKKQPPVYKNLNSPLEQEKNTPSVRPDNPSKEPTFVPEQIARGSGVVNTNDQIARGSGIDSSNDHIARGSEWKTGKLPDSGSHQGEAGIKQAIWRSTDPLPKIEKPIWRSTDPKPEVQPLIWRHKLTKS